jgi:Alpha-L-arabinofuranosidase B, catalytic/Polysaccharide lyase
MMKRVLVAALLAVAAISAAVALVPQKQTILRALQRAAAPATSRSLQNAAARQDSSAAAASPVRPRTDVPMLDAYPGATYAISLRRLRSGYSGPAIRIQRASDKATLDIGFSSGGDLDMSVAKAFCAATACGISVVYDQSGAGCGNAVQMDAGQQFQLVLSGTADGKPVMRGSSVSGMRVPDCAAYKTPAVDAFVVARIGSRNGGPGFRGGTIIGYPRTRVSDVMDFAWGVSASGHALQFQVYVANSGYNNNTSNPDGLAAFYRNRLFQYEFSTARQDIRYNTKVFMPANPPVSIAYANAVGLVIGADAAGNNALQGGDLAEIVLYGSPQSPRDEISAAQSAYWGISEPPPTMTTSDGMVWAPVYRNDWKVKFPINGRNYFTESAGDLWSMWRATNASAPLWRFEVRQGDADNITGNERSELDGAASPSWPADTTVQISYAVLLEPGAPVQASWNVLGQYHYDKAAYPPASIGIGLMNDFWSIEKDGPTSMVRAWRSSERIKRNAWYDFFIEQKVSSSGRDDVLMAWIDGTRVLNLSGALFPHGRQPGYWKIGIYRGDVVRETEIARYANLEIVDKATTPIDSRITSPLPHPMLR